MKKTLRIIFLSVVALCLGTSAQAQWTDVTDVLLRNPGFDEGITGWERYATGSSTVNYSALEFWDNPEFRVFQVVSGAPAGRYRLSCQAYFRAGDDGAAYEDYTAGKEEITARLYANDEETPIPSIYSEGRMWGGDIRHGRLYYPNSMGDGRASFDQGLYAVSLETRHTGGDLEVGVYSTDGVYHNWCQMSNFKLEYYGQLPAGQLENIWFESDYMEISYRDAQQLTLLHSPANASLDGVLWESSDESVARVDGDGVVEGVGEGECVITARCGSLESSIYVRVVRELLRNPSFDWGADYWTVDVPYAQNKGFQGSSYENGDVYISRFVEAWIPTERGYRLGDGEIWQETWLPKGWYTLEADVIASWQGGNDDVEGVYLFAETERGLTQVAVATASGKPQHYVFAFEVKGNEEPVRVGIRLEDATANWVAADNFWLEQIDAYVKPTRLTLTGDNSTLMLGETRQLTATIVPANATFPEILWESDDPDVLTVTPDGLVRAVGLGTATISATAKDNAAATATMRFTVEDAPSELTGLCINEVMSMNADQFVDPSWNYGGWIEIYNSTASPVSLYGCYVTDDPDNLLKHQLRNAGVVQGKGFYTIWFDHFSDQYKDHALMVDFKLDTDGGWIALVSPDGEVLAELTYPAGVQRTSWARRTNGSDEWGITAQPTPGASNNGSPFATERLAAPTVDVEGHLVTGYPVIVHAEWPEGSTLRYTTDGSVPTATNGETSRDGEFVITEGNYTTLRLCAVQDGYLPSPVTTNTYIYKQPGLTIPVLAVSGSDNDFFSNQMGMFVNGTNGVAGGPGTVANVFRDWERPGVMEYYEPETGERLFCQEVGLSPAGGWTRLTNYGSVHTSFKIKASKQYGLNSLDYQFFPEKPFLKHKVLQIRNGGNDRSRFKDAALQQIVARSGFYVDYQAYQPVFHYINGRYACVFNMREPNNKHHAYSNYGLDTDLMDQFELTSHPTYGPDGEKNYYEQMVGTRDTFDLWCQLAEQCEDPAVYQRICDELVDIDEFINYMAAEFWLGPGDWLSNTNNLKAFRSTEGDGKFHFVMFDLDSAFDGGNQMDAIEWQNGNSHVIQRLWKNMLRNEQFRKQFVDAFCLVSGSVFEPSRCEAIINELADVAQPMMDLSGEGWQVENMRNDLLGKLGGNGSRRTTALNYLRNYYRVADQTLDPINLTFSANNSEARLLFNGQNVPTERFTGRLYLPVTLTAGEVPGYDFAGWQMRGGLSQNSQRLFANGSQWNYYDQPGGLDGEDWTSKTFFSSWAQGNAPVGYDSNNKNGHPLHSRYRSEMQPTYYLAKTVSLDSKGENDIFTLNYKVDDGMVVYVNGEEAGRFNMPGGAVSYNTYTPTYKFEEGSMNLPARLFRQGENTIAVELHNYNATSTDIYWDAELLQQSTEETEGELVSADPQLELDAAFDGAELVAVYCPAATLADVPVKVNEVSAGNDIYVNDYYKKDDWIELYNTTDEPVDVAGMWLTDNANKPQKFQIPDNDEQLTVIEPHGRLVIWASKRDNKGKQIHANFKLANGDGETVMLTSEEGDWHTWLTYNAHSAKETVGLFPDGGNSVYRMTHPTIAKPNALTSYARFLYFNDERDPYVPPTPETPTFTLNLSEGWNWMSHPLEREVATSELNARALQFVSQTSMARKNGDTWTGKLTSLAPATAYKVQMAADDAITLEAPFYDTSRGISLRLGWSNWIGYPCTVSQPLEEAFARFTPTEGDGILGRQGFAIYENGKWEGTLTSLDPGQGYIYGAKEATTLTLSESAPASVSEQARKSAPRFHAQPRSPWTAVDAPYPDVLGMVCELQQDGVRCEPGAFTLAAFAEDGECRGVGHSIDGLIYLSVFGTGGERFTLQAVEAATGVVYEVAGSPFITNAILGTRKEPLPMGIGTPTDIASVKEASGAQSLGYYRIDGTFAGREQSALPRGIYVKKCRLSDGTVLSKKTIVWDSAGK